MQIIKLRNGDNLSHNGTDYRVRKTISVSVTAEQKTDFVTDPKKEGLREENIPVVQGEQQSDPAQAIDKGTVLGLIQKEIETLEKHENALLMEGVFDVDDDLDLVDQQRGESYKTANYAATAVHVMNLKSLYKKVKNLS
jgi:hypothetical protein